MRGILLPCSETSPCGALGKWKLHLCKTMKLEMYLVLSMIAAHFGIFFYYANRLNKESEENRFSN